jgi:hypothetical protein
MAIFIAPIFATTIIYNHIHASATTKASARRSTAMGCSHRCTHKQGRDGRPRKSATCRCSEPHVSEACNLNATLTQRRPAWNEASGSAATQRGGGGGRAAEPAPGLGAGDLVRERAPLLALLTLRLRLL